MSIRLRDGTVGDAGRVSVFVDPTVDEVATPLVLQRHVGVAVVITAGDPPDQTLGTPPTKTSPRFFIVWAIGDPGKKVDIVGANLLSPPVSVMTGAHSVFLWSESSQIWVDSEDMFTT